MKLLKLFLRALLAACVVTPVAEAQQAACQGNGAGAPNCAAAGNPINVINGNKFQREVDLPALPGVMGLEIVRYYNSSLSGIHSRIGIIGRGWRLGYEMTLAVVGDTVQIIEADGRRLIFARDPLHPSLCSSQDPANGEIDIRRTPNGDEYIWRKNDGKRLTFNSKGQLVQILAPTGEFVSMQHDARGWLVKVTDPQGRSLKLNYLDNRQANGQRFRGVQSIDTPVGNFTYGYGSELPKGADVAGRRALLANLVQVRTPGAEVRQYHYEDARFPTLLTGISVQGTDRQGKPVMQRFATWGYDGNATAVLSTHANNVGRITLDTSVGGQTVLTNSLGQKTVYRYGIVAGELRVQEVRGAGCAQCGEPNVRYGYDTLGRMASVTYLDRTGAAWRADTTRYDYYGRPLEVRRIVYRDGKQVSSRQLVRLEYAAGTGMMPSLIGRPSAVAGRELQVRFRYNAMGQPIERTETGWSPAAQAGEPERISRTTSFRYTLVNARSVLAEVDGPLSNGPTQSPVDSDITRLTWSADGSRVVSVAAPGNFRSDFDYDTAGRLAGLRDESGAVTSFVQDEQGRLTAMVRDGVRHTVKYDATGNLLEQGTGEGRDYRADKRYGYDEAGRNIWIASALGILTRSQFDSEDRLVKSARMSSHFLQQQSLRYDEFGRPIEIRDGSGAQRAIAWDARDLPATIRDALGRELQLAYDSEGELVRATPAANVVRGPLLARTAGYERDANGNLNAVTVGNGATTRYVRDDFGRTTAVISADSGLTSYRYDAAGRLLQKCEADGACASYRYDLAGRVTERTITERKGAGSTTSWHYAGRRLIRVDNAAQSETYEYDSNGLLTAQTVILHIPGGAAISSSRSFRYDAARQLVSTSLPDGSEISYVRNGQGQVVRLERSRIRTPWLRWLLPKQTIVSGLERDIVGLRHVRYGNGIEGIYQRAPSGTLARIVYRREQATPGRIVAAERFLGIGEAHAAEVKTPTGRDEWAPGALIDRRYWWDLQGNLRFTTQPNSVNAYAYDPLDRLIVAESKNAAGAQPAGVNRYFVDGIGNRLLALERGATVGSHYEPNSSRSPASDQAGRQTSPAAPDAGRRYVWRAGGLLAEVWRGDTRLAAYRYNHRGERIEKRNASGTSYFLYEDRKVVAELDAQGRVLRQYIYLSDMPVAVLDAGGRPDAPAVQRGAFAQALTDIGIAVREWFGSSSRIAYLHNNHLGATEAATDDKGNVVWAAEYQPFGRLASLRRQSGFVMKLRLPGQFEDEETGLYYNDHRYYDPDGGRYISPDPLGLRGGLNSYSYADGNPLRFVDPSGLLLFAFDGTGNSDHPDAAKNESLSNVWKFWSVYEGDKYYITGIGTTDDRVKYEGSMYDGDGINQRLDRAFTDLDAFILDHKDEEGPLTIDVVGFSRGAATARAWLNQLTAKLTGGAYKVGEIYRCIDFNFAGLWETVPHLGLRHGDESKYNFAIPAGVKFAAHAVALNEHRGFLADFNGLSILQSASAAQVPNRIERSFLGAHSDIGGSYGTGDLSDVALMWMIDQADQHGLQMNREKVEQKGWDVVTDPLLHDSNTSIGIYGIDREFFYLNGSSVEQRDKNDGTGMTWKDTRGMMIFNEDGRDLDTHVVGTVSMAAYCKWLNDHAYFKGKSVCK